MAAMLRFLLALLALFAATPAMADPGDIAAAGRSVVRIVLVSTDGDYFYYVGHGSGIVVAPNTIVTNAHVVEGAVEDDTLTLAVVPSEGKRAYMARIVAVSQRNDLALIKLTEPSQIPAASLFSGAVTDNAEVFALGYPSNVDRAQGLGLQQLIQPTAAVPGVGHVFTGRKAGPYDALLHTASIGSGNSGGPLLDGCGRVIGINASGTITDNGTDASFYFAVSMRELLPFLSSQGIKAQVVGTPCRSIADLNQLESKLSAEEQARLAAQRDAKAKSDAAARDKARTEAERQVLTERDNLLALAAVLLVAALGAGGASLMFSQRQDDRKFKIAGGIAVALLLAAIIAWLLRPSLASIDDRTDDLMPDVSATATDIADKGTGKMICVIDTERSRVTVSGITDVPLEWSETGCVNGKTQYGLGGDGWSRILVPNKEEAISVNSYDPASRTYKVERYLVGLDTMEKARAERGKFSPPQCSAGEEGARALGQSQAAIKALLTDQPNERLIYHCSPAP